LAYSLGNFLGNFLRRLGADQTGNVIQWTDADRTNGFRLLRGSSWYDNPEVPFRLSSSYRLWPKRRTPALAPASASPVHRRRR